MFQLIFSPYNENSFLAYWLTLSNSPRIVTSSDISGKVVSEEEQVSTFFFFGITSTNELFTVRPRTCREKNLSRWISCWF